MAKRRMSAAQRRVEEKRIPFEVSEYVYEGISESIRELLQAHRIGKWDDFCMSRFLAMPKSIEWYKSHDFISSQSRRLEEGYKNLSDEIEGKHFMYDMYAYYRFGLVVEVLGEKVEQLNQIAKRELVTPKGMYRDINVGTIFKHRGYQVRIVRMTEYGEDQNKYGEFVAEALPMRELIKSSRGGN